MKFCLFQTSQILIGRSDPIGNFILAPNRTSFSCCHGIWSYLRGRRMYEFYASGAIFLFLSLCLFPCFLGLGWTWFHLPGIPQEIPDPSRCGPSCHNFITVLWWGPHCEWTKETGLWPWAHHSHHPWREACCHCSPQEVDALSLTAFFKTIKFPHQWMKICD